MESALLKSRSESPRNINLRVHFKHPIEEDAMSTLNIRNTREMGRMDPLVRLHAKEIIAAKLIEGYTMMGNEEKCQYCHMPLMVKENPWEGVLFCGQDWIQGQKTGICVVCPENEVDDESNASSQNIDVYKKEYGHRIPSFPEDDDSHGLEEDYSSDSHDHGSVGEFKKKFAITSDVRIKKIEMNTEVDEICAKELKQAVATSPEGSRNCPSCGMEMLDFGEDLECPFCALEIIKEELGISAVDVCADGSSEVKRSGKKEKRRDVNVEGLYLSDEVAASSSCSTLSASVRFAQDGPTNQCDGAVPLAELAPIAKAPSSESTQLAIKAILKRLRDDRDDVEKISTAREKSIKEFNRQDQTDNEKTSDADSSHMTVNAVLKRLITGFWKENNEFAPQEAATDRVVESELIHGSEANKVNNEQATNDALSAEVDGSNNDEASANCSLNEQQNGAKPNNDEASVRGIDELQDRVKAFAAIVFGSRADKAEMFKSNQIKMSPEDIQEDDDSANAPEQEACGEAGVYQNGAAAKIQDEDTVSNASDARSNNNPSSVEGAIFEEEMSTDDIVATLNEIEAVTKNILDLPVFSGHQNDDVAEDLEATSREDEETSFRTEEDTRRSTIDPPSVCSRNSRDSPIPSRNTNTSEPTDENLLLTRKENASAPSPDMRDPPTSVSDKYQPRLEFSFSETVRSSPVDRLPRDPSEHGGSLELDSFSQEDATDETEMRHIEEFKPLLSESSRNFVTSKDLHPQSSAAVSSRAPAELVPSPLVVANHRVSSQTRAYRGRAEPVGTSSSVISHGRSMQQVPAVSRCLSRTEASTVSLPQKREPMEPESSPVSFKLDNVTPLQANDLYQRPDILTKIVNEPESSRDAVVRHRLIQLNTRYHKLTSQSDASLSESDILLDSQLESRYQNFAQSNTQTIFREQRFTFDNIDLHPATVSSGVSSVGIKGSGSGLSPSAAARHERYKKQLCETVRSHCGNDTVPCLSPSAAQRRQHYKEVLMREQMARGSQMVSQE